MKKMILTAYENNTFSKKLGIPPYTLMINPSSVKVSLGIEYSESGTKKNSGKYKGKSSMVYDFDFVVDGTGVVDNDVRGSIMDNIRHFKDVVYNHVSKSHRPPFVEICYCDDIFRCVANNVDIDYNLFDRDGNPLRAKISCRFTEVVNLVQNAKKEDNQSPDITHMRKAVDGDLLVTMSRNVYGSDGFYIDVAKANGLNNFRRLEPGKPVFFPPLKDE